MPHKTGLRDIFWQGNDFENLKILAIASRCTKQTEKNYAL